MMRNDPKPNMTAPRRMVLDIISRAKVPLKAYDLVGRVKDDGHIAKPPTIYRALDFLCKEGLVHKISSDSTYVICNHGNHCDRENHIPYILICVKCGSVSEVHLFEIDNIVAKTALARDFIVEKTSIESHGVCVNCRV